MSVSSHIPFSVHTLCYPLTCGHLRDVPSISCVAVDFLKISENIYNAF